MFIFKGSENRTLRKRSEFSKLGAITIVFIAIILILGFLVAINKVGSKKRDKERSSDLKAVKEALFSYYKDNGYYPSSISNWDPDSSDYGAETMSGANDYDNLISLISDIVPDLPKDPLNKANSPAISDIYLYRYVAAPNGQNFAIIYETEDKGDDSPAVIRGW